MKNKGGRPLKLTSEMREALIAAVKEGLTLKAACKYAGISYSTFANWRQKSRRASKDNESTPFTQLVTEIDIEILQLKRQHRLEAKANHRSRDFRYGWKNPMPLQARKKISDF